MDVSIHDVVKVKENIGHHKLGDEVFVTRTITVIDKDSNVIRFKIFGAEESKVLTSSMEVTNHD